MNVSNDGPDLDGLFPSGAFYGHDDEEIDVAVRSGLVAGVGAEENDSVRIELFDDPADHSLDLGFNRRL